MSDAILVDIRRSSGPRRRRRLQPEEHKSPRSREIDRSETKLRVQIDYREPGRQAGPEIDRDAAPEPRTGHMGTPNRLGLI
ncbi:hypothetical protein [Oryza sativa Japonica Group]|jgi:hypothetical protein|uniref:Uncharacterized protein n=5 Tax=Oryza TaxID=4527 RepID=Q5NAT2_ORYSJ|nr:hypothetical protein [Oryza sativa Japonica Group]BAD81422.1 hypothetical protein [Oryza sativa Japonica Group]